MTKALYNKAIETIRKYQIRHPDYYVYNCRFKYYGKWYRVEENLERFKIFRINHNSIHDTLIGIINK